MKCFAPHLGRYRSACAHRLYGSRGFTLIEVMTVISVMAILTALAAPSFSRLIANQRDKAVASELFMALSKTRNEAITRNANVTLSAKTGGWQNGWQILDPANAANVLEDHGAATGATITGPSGPASVIFRASGRVQAGSTPSFLVTTTADASSFYQCISVDLNGRPYMKAAQTC